MVELEGLKAGVASGGTGASTLGAAYGEDYLHRQPERRGRKTTTAINLGAYLAEAGKFVLVVETWTLSPTPLPVSASTTALWAGVYETVLGTAHHREIVQPTAHETLRVAPSTTALAGLNIELVEMEQREYRLYDALLEIRNAITTILIDCPPTLGLITLNGIVAADEVLIPVQAEYYAPSRVSASFFGP